MGSDEPIQEETRADELIWTPEQQIATLIAAIELEANKEPPQIAVIRPLITLLKTFFALYQRGELPPVLESTFPPEVWAEIHQGRLPWGETIFHLQKSPQRKT